MKNNERYLKRNPVILRAVVISSALFMLLAGACMLDCKSAARPSAVKGILDLRKIDMDKTGSINLTGEWEFYWNEHLTENDFEKKTKPKLTAYAVLPGFWNRIKVDGKHLPSYGYATYRLRVLLDKPYGRLSFYHGCIYYAFNLFVNGELITSQGVLATSPEKETAENRPMTVDIPLEDKELDIILQVSNYHHINGGPGEMMSLGMKNSIEHTFEIRVFFEFFLFGCFAIMAVYHLILFIHRRRDRAHLFFAIFCICAAILVVGSFSQVYFFKLFFPQIPRDIRYLIVFAAISLMPPSIYSFFRSVFPSETSRIFEIFLWLVSIIFISSPIYLNVQQIVYLEKANEGLIILSLLSCLISTLLAILHRREGSFLIFIGFILLSASAIVDILAVNDIMFTYDTTLSPFALLAFILFMAYLLASRLSKTFSRAERLNIELDRDIEKRKQIEQKLTETWSYLDNVFNSLSAVLVSVDKDCNITGWNRRAEKLTHIASEGAIGKPVWEILPLVEKHKKAIKNVINHGTSKALARVSFMFESMKFFDVVVTPLSFGEMKGAVILADEVTEIEKKDQQLRQIQKMEMIGTLAGGLAHDFNNILAGIIGPLTIIQNRRKSESIYDSELIEKYIPVINDSAGKASDMVKRLLALSRKHEVSYLPVDLNQSLKNSLMICENTFDKSIEIEATYNQSQAFVHADSAQMEQAILNLCVNAAHAMTIMKPKETPYGGKLTVSIGKMHVDSVFSENHPDASVGNYWTLTVRDTGVGMTEETQLKIFDPFFTTKPVELGTGLGLSMVYSIVRQHGGFITLYTEQGSGSQFIVYLPVYEESSSDFLEFDYRHPKFNSELVLVIDDDPNVRSSLEVLLNEIGLSSILASSGAEGIDLLKEHSSNIKAIILDMIMPVKPGREIFLEIKSISPDIPVIISSGFSRDDRIETMFLLGVRGFIQKPYNLHNLIKVMAAVIDSRVS